MPRPKSIVPTYRLHKATGQAVVYVNRQEVYLGPHGSPESRKAYSNLLAGLEANPDSVESSASPTSSQTARPVFTMNDLLLRFVTTEMGRYSDAEQRCIKSAIRFVREMYGETAASEFGPLRLRKVREAMIRHGWSRSFMNKEINRIRMIVRWAVGWELVPPSVADALSAVKSLSCGESDARETRPRHAVAEANLKAVRMVLCERHRDIFDLFLLTGARSGELLNLTTGDIDRTGEIWRAGLSSHKTAHKGKSRTLFFNAKAQLILTKYLNADPSRRLFTIRGDTLSKAFRSACERAGVPQFTPHWLRHTVATTLADEIGTEAAQRLLGHASRAMTEHYSTAAERQAVEAVKRLGS